MGYRLQHQERFGPRRRPSSDTQAHHAAVDDLGSSCAAPPCAPSSACGTARRPDGPLCRRPLRRALPPRRAAPLRRRGAVRRPHRPRGDVAFAEDSAGNLVAQADVLSASACGSPTCSSSRRPSSRPASPRRSPPSPLWGSTPPPVPASLRDSLDPGSARRAFAAPTPSTAPRGPARRRPPPVRPAAPPSRPATTATPPSPRGRWRAPTPRVRLRADRRSRGSRPVRWQRGPRLGRGGPARRSAGAASTWAAGTFPCRPRRPPRASISPAAP